MFSPANTYVFLSLIIFFLGAHCVFGPFISLLKQYLLSSVPGSLILMLEQYRLLGVFGLLILLTTLCFTYFTFLRCCA